VEAVCTEQTVDIHAKKGDWTDEGPCTLSSSNYLTRYSLTFPLSSLILTK